MSQVTSNPQTSLVVLSGGQDSVTCAYHAKQSTSTQLSAAIYVDYGSQHKDVELACAKFHAEQLQIPLHVLSGELLGQLTLSHTALTDPNGDVSAASIWDPTLPASFVPGRNLYMILIAAIWGACNLPNFKQVITGVCQTDYSGYPDCRNQTMEALEEAISNGFGRNIEIKTPLMFIDKAATFAMAAEMGKTIFNNIIRMTHTGYTGDRSCLHPWGFGPAENLDPASLLRKKGYEQFLIEYPELAKAVIE